MSVDASIRQGERIGSSVVAQFDCNQRRVAVADEMRCERANEPQDLERLLVSRQQAGDCGLAS